MKDHAILMNEVRYAERLCERTARLYRRIETFGTYASIGFGGGAIASMMASAGPFWSGAMVALFGLLNAALLSIRPADKAAANEADRRRYAKLRTAGQSMPADELAVALLAAKEDGAPEVESLRLVAYNDVVREVGQDSYVQRLPWHQRALAVIA